MYARTHICTHARDQIPITIYILDYAKSRELHIFCNKVSFYMCILDIIYENM